MLKTFKIALISLLLLGCGLSAPAQPEVRGHFPGHAGQGLRLTGFAGLQAVVLDSVQVSPQGEFRLSYPAGYTGMGILSAGAQQSHILVLEPGGVVLQGSSLAEKDRLRIDRGPENRWFDTYAVEHPRREQVLSGWAQMQSIYTQDPLFSNQAAPQQAIAREMARLRAEDSLYLAGLPEDSYVKWYLPHRSLVSSVQLMAAYRTEEIPAAIARFRAMDFTDPRWQTSGLLKDAIEAHVWLIENSAGPLEAVYAELNRSTDSLLASLQDEPQLLNPVTDHLFRFMEQRSLFEASEYLVLKMGEGEEACELSAGTQRKLAAYRNMQIGKTAPDIAFGTHTRYPAGTQAPKLSALEANYKLVVFAAGWCPHCVVLMPELAAQYDTWQAQGLEVVLVTLDETLDNFERFTGELPFLCTTDLQKWEGQAVQDYYVNGTPTMYLLDYNNKILDRPRSAEDVNIWMNGMKQGSNLRLEHEP